MMDPNEMQDFGAAGEVPAADVSTGDIPAGEAQVRPTAPRAETVVHTQPSHEPQNGAYHGAGVGRQEVPGTNSPYQNAYRPRQDWNQAAWQQYQYRAQPQQPQQTQPAKQKKKRGIAGKIVAAVLAVALVAGSCGATAFLVNRHWEDQVSTLQTDLKDQRESMAQMQEQLADMQHAASVGTGVSVSGTVVSQEGLTPAQVYAQNVNSVVAVSNYATYSSGWGGSGSLQLASTGSGFIISEDGYVMTNYHVVEGAEKLTFTTFAGDEYEATLVGYDELNDVALMKADAEGLDPVEMGSSDDLIIGDMVVAIGNPLGELTSTQTVGYVSGKDRAVSTDGTIINMLQTDAAINSGNSGGPLFNMKGQVIGITTAKYSGDSGSGATIEGIGFAIPIDDVISMIDDFKEYGYLKNQAYLGVLVRDLTATNASEFSLPTGAYVTEVYEDSSAEKAGVEAKDIIIGLGDIDVTSMAELTAALRKFSAGDTTTITVYRAGRELELEITFDEKPASTETEPEQEQVPEESYGGYGGFGGFGDGFQFGFGG